MDSEKKLLPASLLSQSKVDRFNYFKNKVFGHDHLLKADDELLNAILYPSGDSLIFVFGPTGVGKTTLLSRLVQKFLEIEREAMLKDPGYLPVVTMEAIASSRSYDWREHLIRFLMAGKEPLIDHKINSMARELSTGKEPITRTDRTELALRRSAELCCHYRGTKLVIVDEAQHFRRTGRERNAQHQMDTIKSLANTTGTIHVLIGTYELVELARLSGQLCRRSTYIHFSRYSNHVPTDQDAFASMLQTFKDHFPLVNSPDLPSFEDYFYEKTFGCIGVLKTMLNKVLAQVLRSENEMFTEEMLEKSAPPLQDLVRMSKEIEEGERFLQKTEDDESEVKTFVMNIPQHVQEQIKQTKKKRIADTLKTSVGETKPEKIDGQSGEQPTTKHRKHRPGERSPKRDKVGRNKKGKGEQKSV